MALLPGKLTKIKSRYKVVDDWQQKTNEYKLIQTFYRTHFKPSNSKPLPSKIFLVLFAYLYIYKSKFSKTYQGKHIKIVSETNKEFEVLNTSNSNPNDFDFRGQLIRMELPLITYQNNVTFEVYFEKIVREETVKAKKKQTKKTRDESGNVLIKGSIVSDNSEDGIVRIKISNFAKFISMNMDKSTKSIIIEVDKSQIVSSNNEQSDSDFETESESGHSTDYDSSDPRYNGFAQGDPFVSGEYYFIGIISNKVEVFDTDTNNYHLDGYGVDNATDYIYVGEGNNVVDTEELNEPWSKPSILNKDVVRVECNMSKKQLTFYKNGIKFGPKGKDYTICFDHYGARNKTFFPAVCVVNKHVKAVFKYL